MKVFFFSPEMILSYINDYNEDEQEGVLENLEVVKKIGSSLHKKNSLQSPLYLATAGAPGTRKSTILERFMKRYVLDSHMTYLDPDQRALKFMVHTYYNKSLSALPIAEWEDYPPTIQNAYKK